MNLNNFIDIKDNDKEYKYKILVYPNITYQKDLEKDSYVVVLGNIIRELNKVTTGDEPYNLEGLYLLKCKTSPSKKYCSSPFALLT